MVRESSRRPPLPRIWFVSAEERGIDCFAVLPALPRGAGVIYRDYRHPDRRARARSLARLCRRHRHQLVTAGDRSGPVRVPSSGVHVPSWGRWPRLGRVIVTLAVHGKRDVRRARTSRADLFIVAPVFRTAAHPDVRPLGPLRLGLLARNLPGPVAALGGITADTARRLRALPVHGLCASGLFAASGHAGDSAGSRVWWGPFAKRPQARLLKLHAPRRSRTHVRLYPRRP